jgi:hypothetical protein
MDFARLLWGQSGGWCASWSVLVQVPLTEEERFMLFDRTIGPKAATALVLVLLLGWVGSADARKFSMSGTWTMEKTNNFFLPIIPGHVAGGGTVTAQGSGPATLSVPANLFTGAFGFGMPMPQTSVVQFTTRFTFAGPYTPVVLRAGAWTATRPFANFAWCPGGTANPACTTPRSTGQGAPPGQGTMHGLVRYTAGPQQFGGTMQMLRTGNGGIALLLGATGPTVQHNPMAVPGGAVQNPGGPYANSRLQPIPGGPITTGCVFSPGGMISVPGTQVGTGASTGNLYQGFPMTTGTVYVKVTIGVVGTTTFSASGSDARTPEGAGNITLQAGGLLQRLVQGRTMAYRDTVAMRMVEPTPSMSPAGLAAGALLMVLAVGYALRRRF